MRLRYEEMQAALACFSSLDAARTAAADFLKRHPELLDAYRFGLERFRRTGPPDYIPVAHAEVLALLSFHYDLGDLATV